MLYVFQMDIGQMLTFDMALLVDVVSKLQIEIARTTGIAVDKQILLLSGGQILKSDQKVITYGAGADTNPVFLFSKLAIENQEPPLIRSFGISKETVVVLKERVTEALKLNPSFDTVTARTRLAVQIRDSASKILSYCNNEFQDQHLQYQGWGAVIANLEEIAQALRRTQATFSKAFNSYLPQRDQHFSLIDNFGDTLELLGRIPLLESLKESEESTCHISVSTSLKDSSITNTPPVDPSTLLEWISCQAQGQSLESMQQKCHDDITMFNEEMFEACNLQVHEVLSLVNSDTHQMKELVGIERRLSELEKRLNEAKKIAKAQNDSTQGLLNHQSKLNTITDITTLLPDLCESHKHQLVQMLEGHQRMVALQNNFRNSKQEMSTNIHQRLGWVMHIETQISKLDSELIFHLKTLKILGCNLELLNQIKASPQVYAEMVVETVRRRYFSQKFTQWAEELVGDSNVVYKKETEWRKTFSRKLGEHFLLHTLFKGFEDMPPNFATKVPRLFDESLPDITSDDISVLKTSVPELEKSLSLPEDCDHFPVLSKHGRESFAERVSFNASVSSRWNLPDAASQPSVVRATEAPAAGFTLPELQESKATEYLPTVSSMTDTMRDAMSSVVEDSSCERERIAVVDGCAAAKAAKAADNNGEDDSKESPLPASSGSSLASGKAENSIVCKETSDSDSGKVHTGSKVASTTASSSPLSSTEFANADFYFEDSMPSPIVDSPGEKKKGGEATSTSQTPHPEAVSALKEQLAEKSNLVKQLESALKQKEDAIASLQQHLKRTSENTDEEPRFVSVGETPDQDLPPDHAVDELKRDSEKDFDADIFYSMSPGTANNIRSRIEPQRQETSTERREEDQVSVAYMEVQNNQSVKQDENGALVSSLRNEIDALKTKVEDLTQLSETQSLEMQSKDSALTLAQAQAAEFQKDLEHKEKIITEVKQEVSKFKVKMSEDLPLMRETLKNVKDSVLENKSQLQETSAGIASSVEFKFVTFYSGIVSDLTNQYTKQIGELQTEMKAQNEDMMRLKNENSIEVEKLRTQTNEQLTALAKTEEEFESKFTQQKQHHDSSSKETEIKHTLEMEIELDKCRAEMVEALEESERNVEKLNKMNEELVKQSKEASRVAEEEKMSLKIAHAEQIAKLYQNHEEELNMREASITKQFNIEMQGKIQEGKLEVETLKYDLEILSATLNSKKEEEMLALKKTLEKEHDDVVFELKQKLEEQRGQMAEILEQNQLEHAKKLTDLKVEWDMERELLTAELSKYKDKFMTTHSETQTGMELLAEVISLTSSASDGSEEINLPKECANSPDVKEGKDVADAIGAKQQQMIDDLNSQLTSANTEIDNLKQELDDVNGKLLSISQKHKSSKPQKQEENIRDEQPASPVVAKGAGWKDFGTSFILMDKEEPSSVEAKAVDTSSAGMRLKDVKISQLERKLMEVSMNLSEKESSSDKVSIRGCDKGDLVLLCLDERHDQYVVFTIGTILHFLHSDSLDNLGLKAGSSQAAKKSWILAEVVDKEYCLAKKPNNRFRVPQGTCFYRVKCKPWRCDFDSARQDKESGKHKGHKTERAVASQQKNVEKK